MALKSGYNEMELKFIAKSGNEALARMAIAALIAPYDPTLEELDEIKTAVSEAVTNAIIHGYEDERGGYVTLRAVVEDGVLSVTVIDQGRGISNLDLAREPLFTTRPDLERSGMGFTIMENFMDELIVESSPQKGTTIIMSRRLGSVHDPSQLS
ncbi:MAG: anti-sigma F factor [Candidatus Carbobacillus altaicus]|nr:anti-sigma F factor [Candidatus Carbobacillus altaicus]